MYLFIFSKFIPAAISGLFFSFSKLLLFINILLQCFSLILSSFYSFLKFNFNKNFNKDKKNKDNKSNFSYR